MYKYNNLAYKETYSYFLNFEIIQTRTYNVIKPLFCFRDPTVKHGGNEYSYQIDIKLGTYQTNLQQSFTPLESS